MNDDNHFVSSSNMTCWIFFSRIKHIKSSDLNVRQNKYSEILIQTYSSSDFKTEELCEVATFSRILLILQCVFFFFSKEKVLSCQSVTVVDKCAKI